MSEEKKQKTVFDVETIPSDIILDCKIEGSFYAWLRDFVFNSYPFPDVPISEFINRCTDPKETDLTPVELGYKNLVNLMLYLETCAEYQNKLKTRKFDLEKDDFIPEETQPDPQASSDTQSPDSTPPSNNQQTT